MSSTLMTVYASWRARARITRMFLVHAHGRYHQQALGACPHLPKCAQQLSMAAKAACACQVSQGAPHSTQELEPGSMIVLNIAGASRCHTLDALCSSSSAQLSLGTATQQANMHLQLRVSQRMRVPVVSPRACEPACMRNLAACQRGLQSHRTGTTVSTPCAAPSAHVRLWCKDSACHSRPKLLDMPARIYTCLWCRLQRTALCAS
jgi:hypothetical protein